MRQPAAGATGFPAGASGLTIHAYRCYLITTGSTSGLPFLLYADNDVGSNTATGFTNAKFQFGGPSSGYLASLGSAANYVVEGELNFNVPSGKFPALEGADTTPVEKCQFWAYSP